MMAVPGPSCGVCNAELGNDNGVWFCPNGPHDPEPAPVEVEVPFQGEQDRGEWVENLAKTGDLPANHAYVVTLRVVLKANNSREAEMKTRKLFARPLGQAFMDGDIDYMGIGDVITAD